MRKIKLYSAISLDGKIAKPDGDVKWLDAIPNPENLDYGYKTFYESIDTTIMGNQTYEEVLGFGVEFPYPNTKNYVLTRRTDRVSNKDVDFISGDVLGFVKNLKQQPGKDIWLIGGSQINTLFLDAGLIDELLIFVMPVVIGPGIPLFHGQPVETLLKVVETKAYPTGVVCLHYSK